MHASIRWQVPGEPEFTPDWDLWRQPANPYYLQYLDYQTSFLNATGLLALNVTEAPALEIYREPWDFPLKAVAALVLVMLSACFSGVYVPELALPNRMVLTAARPDRTSFGCGEADKYPYFDDCMLQSLPQARDFIALAANVRTCVSARELKEGMKPPSEPQLWIGPQLRPMLPLYGFAQPPPALN